MKKSILLYLLITSLAGTIIIFSSYAKAEDSREVSKEESKVVHTLPQVIKGVDLNKVFTFAGVTAPNTPDALERLDRELSVNAYWQSSTLLNMKSANRYFPIMERILAENGVPTDFKYLAVAESNLRNVVSSASAKGFWQFRKLAAKEFKLEVNDEVDERYHVEKATEAAAKYLKQLHKRFGSWVDAAAAYNIGPTRYARIKKQQGEDSYFGLNLTDETSRYVFRLFAIKDIFTNPNDYGFFVDNKYDLFPEFYNVTIDKSVSDWGAFARQHGISYRELKIYNPWLIDSKLTVINNVYTVKIPR